MKIDLVSHLKKQVEEHEVLQMPWLVSRAKQLSKKDLSLWLGQELFVSKAFVNWFLIAAAMTNNVRAKIILVENVWEELGEGDSSQAHIIILEEFLKSLGIDPNAIQCLEETREYLRQMENIVRSDFFKALGALGPANEYLLKLEYGKVYKAFLALKEKEFLPEGKFFNVNLEADEGHSARLFALIQDLTKTELEIENVIQGNESALQSRKIFYNGLQRISSF